MTNVFQEDKKNKKLSLEKVIKRHRTRLQTSGVIKGAQLIQSGMDLLAPEVSLSLQDVVTMLLVTIFRSQGRKSLTATIPSL